MYGIDDRDSYEAIEERINDLETCAYSKCVKTLVGNKSDTSPKRRKVEY